MTSESERFWNHDSYAIVGHQAKRAFPRVTYAGMKRRGMHVFAVDPESPEIEGDPAYREFEDLPRPVDAAILELPKDETAEWVAKAADAGIREIWIHQMTDTPEALAEAKRRGLHTITGHCAVMYTLDGLSLHSPHRVIWKLIGKY
ncbi:MAG: CoA-binding protein [Thermoleophilia bacterium]